MHISVPYYKLTSYLQLDLNPYNLYDQISFIIIVFLKLTKAWYNKLTECFEDVINYPWQVLTEHEVGRETQCTHEHDGVGEDAA